MNIPPRWHCGLLCAGTLIVAWMWLGSGAGAEEAAPENPLRQASAVSPIVPPKPVQRVAAAPQIVGSAPSAARTESAVRRWESGLVAPQRLPSRYAVFRNVAAGTGAGAAPKTAPSAPKVSPGPARSAPVDGEIVYEGVQPGTGELFYEEDVFGDLNGDLPMEVAGFPDCCGGVGCAARCLVPCPIIPFRNLELFLGVHGFTGPMNRGATGSFGFDEGVNLGIPIPCTHEAVSGQVGMRATQSNFSGAEFTDATRQQIFVTGGLFRRVDWGLQGGVVVDYLADDWYADVSLVQLRGELSWVFPCTHELGFWFAAGDRTLDATSLLGPQLVEEPEVWEPTNWYTFFYRRRFHAYDGAEARFFAGFTGGSDGLIGGDLRLPLGDRWALNAGFTYLVPEEPAGMEGYGYAEEAWNVALTLVWYPGCRMKCGGDYSRPLFDVAGNGTFLVDRRHAE